MVDLNTVVEKNNDKKNDDDGAPLGLPLRNTYQANCELIIKKSPENKSKAREKLAPKNSQVRMTNVRIKKSTM